MKLLDLVKDLDFECVQGSTDIDVTTLVYDSRKVEQGSVFVCISAVQKEWATKLKHFHSSVMQATAE